MLAKNVWKFKLLKWNTVNTEKSKKRKLTVIQSSLQITEDTLEVTQKF